MTISIVIPSYNGERYIGEAIESVLNQTCPADEVIVSDDKSADSTLDICRRYGHRIKVFRNENGPSGFVNGWNNAIAHSTCEYVSVLHQDDILKPTFIEEAKKTLTMYPNAKHFFVPCEYIDKNGIVIRRTLYEEGGYELLSGQEYVKAYMFQGHPHIHRCPGVVTKRSIFAQCTYREDAGHIADDDFFYRVGQYTDVAVCLKHLAQYREHASSETGHLEEKEMLRRLTHDWRYQLEQMKYNCLLDDEFFLFACKELLRYTQLQLLYSIRFDDNGALVQYNDNRRAIKRLGLRLAPKFVIYHYIVQFCGLRFTHYLTWLRYGNKKALLKRMLQINA